TSPKWKTRRCCGSATYSWDWPRPHSMPSATPRSPPTSRSTKSRNIPRSTDLLFDPSSGDDPAVRGFDQYSVAAGVDHRIEKPGVQVVLCVITPAGVYRDGPPGTKRVCRDGVTLAVVESHDVAVEVDRSLAGVAERNGLSGGIDLPENQPVGVRGGRRRSVCGRGGGGRRQCGCGLRPGRCWREGRCPGRRRGACRRPRPCGSRRWTEPTRVWCRGRGGCRGLRWRRGCGLRLHLRRGWGSCRGWRCGYGGRRGLRRQRGAG